MTDTSAAQGRTPSKGMADRLVDAAIKLLATEGPSAIKARTVAAEAGMSSMVVYSNFGGIPELVAAVTDRGFDDLGTAFAELPVSDDPVADLFAMALATIEYARANPHLYDAMFGLSTRSTYRPAADKDMRLAGHSAAFRATYSHVTEACGRLAESDRVDITDPRAVAGALWSYVHGFIMLDLVSHFAEFDDPIAAVLVPMGVTFCVGLGDNPVDALASHQLALTRARSA